MGRTRVRPRQATALHSILTGPVYPDSRPHESMAQRTSPPHGVLSSVHIYLGQKPLLSTYFSPPLGPLFLHRGWTPTVTGTYPPVWCFPYLHTHRTS